MRSDDSFPRSLSFLLLDICRLPMASQEGIELGRLRARRCPDHHSTRTGATSGPVSQISATDQTSESTEAELTHHPSSTLPGSEYTIQDTSETGFLSSDKSPLIVTQAANAAEGEEEGEDPRASPGKSRDSVPWTLRRLSLLGLIAFLIALIAALEVLHYFSKKNQGLVTTDPADQDATYLWKYLPTASETNELR
jgi:hypothetical protein